MYCSEQIFVRPMKQYADALPTAASGRTGMVRTQTKQGNQRMALPQMQQPENAPCAFPL